MLELIDIPTSQLIAELQERNELPRPVAPLAFSWEQIDLAIRLHDPNAQVSFVYEMTIPAGTSGWVEASAEEGRIFATRYFIEWGDPSVRVKHAYNTKERLYMGLHYVPSSPTTFMKAKFWEFDQKWYMFYENTDLVNKAEYHLVEAALLPKSVEWIAIHPQLVATARAFLHL